MLFEKGPKHPRWTDDAERLNEIRSRDLGTLRLTSDVVVRGARSRQYVEFYCTACKTTRELLVDNIISGKTRNCRCQRNVKYHDPRAKVLGERYDAMVQRCHNPHCETYRNYGERFISVLCTREEFIFGMLERYPDLDFRQYEIDRENNDGDYSFQNMRWVSSAENKRNKSTNKKINYRGEMIVAADLYDRLKVDFPEFSLSRGTTGKLAAQGCSIDDILSRRARGSFKA